MVKPCHKHGFESSVYGFICFNFSPDISGEFGSMELMIKHYKAGTKAEEMLEEDDKLGVATKIKIEKKRVEAPPPASKHIRLFRI